MTWEVLRIVKDRLLETGCGALLKTGPVFDWMARGEKPPSWREGGRSERFRDWWIVEAVDRICRLKDIKPTGSKFRDGQSGYGSACRLVADRLRWKYSKVEKIWLRRKELQE